MDYIYRRPARPYLQNCRTHADWLPSDCLYHLSKTSATGSLNPSCMPYRIHLLVYLLRPKTDAKVCWLVKIEMIWGIRPLNNESTNWFATSATSSHLLTRNRSYSDISKKAYHDSSESNAIPLLQLLLGCIAVNNLLVACWKWPN